MDAKSITIDYHFLDNQSCTRCMETEKTLESSMDNIQELLTKAGYHLSLNKVKMDSREKAIEYQFIKSPTIRVNNVDIGFEQMENSCSDCGELCGCGEDTTCRTWLFNNQEYEIPPKELITERILQVAFSNPAHVNEFKLPDNLERFYTGKNKDEKKECCDSNCCS